MRRFVEENLDDKLWIVSYDDANPIWDLYKGYRWRSYKIGYSARDSREGTEIMFFSDRLHIGPLAGPVRLIGGSHMSGDDDQYSPEETARRMERGLRRALSTRNAMARIKSPPKRKERPTLKGRVHKWDAVPRRVRIQSAIRTVTGLAAPVSAPLEEGRYCGWEDQKPTNRFRKVPFGGHGDRFRR